MGISVKMITGDQLLIGKETAKQLGMGTNMFTTEALLKVGRWLSCGVSVWFGFGAAVACGVRGLFFGWAAQSPCSAGVPLPALLSRLRPAVGALRFAAPPPHWRPRPPCARHHRPAQAKQGFGLVEGHASVEDLIEEVGWC